MQRKILSVIVAIGFAAGVAGFYLCRWSAAPAALAPVAPAAPAPTALVFQRPASPGEERTPQVTKTARTEPFRAALDKFLVEENLSHEEAKALLLALYDGQKNLGPDVLDDTSSGAQQMQVDAFNDYSDDLLEIFGHERLLGILERQNVFFLLFQAARTQAITLE